MLKNTLILPEDNARLAARLLREAIDALDVVLMLVFGKDAEAEQIAGWADQLADKTRVSDTFNIRRVVWIRAARSKAVRDVLGSLRETDGDRLDVDDLPRVAILDFHDRVRQTIARGDPVDPIKLELLYLEGQKS